MRRAALAALGVALLAGGCASEDNPNVVTVTATTREVDPQAEATDRTGGLFAAIPNLVRAVEPSVVAVTVENGEGSGVVWDTEGIVVTNNHVVEGSDRVEVVFASGDRAGARVRATDPLSDLAVLEVEADSLPAARFSEELPRVGELAVAIGNPLGFENSVTAGIVSGVHRMIPAGGRQAQALVDLIQTDAAISPGNSGGALVNAEGEVMGIKSRLHPA